MAFQANMNSQFAKTKMCKFELIGCCLKGSSCQFAHVATELQPLPDLSCTKLCPTYIKHGFCGDLGCTFAHNKVEVRATHAFHKTKICRFFPSGRCERGSHCTFAHSADELQSQPLPSDGLEFQGEGDNLPARPSSAQPQVWLDVTSRSDDKAKLANAEAHALRVSHQHEEDKLRPAFSLLFERLGDMHEIMMAEKMVPRMMDAETETETQCSESQSQGHADGTSTPTSSEAEDDQLIGEAINAHQDHLPSRTIHLFPFVAQKPNFQGNRMTVAPPPGLELNHSDVAWRSVGVVERDDIWNAQNLFCDLEL